MKIMSTIYYDGYRAISFQVNTLVKNSVRYSGEGASIYFPEDALEELKQQIGSYFENNNCPKKIRGRIVNVVIDDLNKTINSFKLRGTAEALRPELNSLVRKIIQTIQGTLESESEEIEHPFTNEDDFRLFQFINKYYKPHNKAKFSYIFEYLKDYLGIPINEKAYFKYVNDLTGLGMVERYQHSANVKRNLQLVKDLARQFKEGKH